MQSLTAIQTDLPKLNETLQRSRPPYADPAMADEVSYRLRLLTSYAVPRNLIRHPARRVARLTLNNPRNHDRTPSQPNRGTTAKNPVE